MQAEDSFTRHSPMPTTSRRFKTETSLSLVFALMAGLWSTSQCRCRRSPQSHILCDAWFLDCVCSSADVRTVQISFGTDPETSGLLVVPTGPGARSLRRVVQELPPSGASPSQARSLFVPRHKVAPSLETATSKNGHAPDVASARFAASADSSEDPASGSTFLPRWECSSPERKDGWTISCSGELLHLGTASFPRGSCVL